MILQYLKSVAQPSFAGQGLAVGKVTIKALLIVVFTHRSREELIAGLKRYLAWFAHPRTLQMVLEEGPDHLR